VSLSLPDLLKLEFKNWSLNVWSKDISAPKVQLNSICVSRGIPVPVQSIRFSGQFISSHPLPSAQQANFLKLEDPIFFENRSYEFEFSFQNEAVPNAVLHRLNSVCDAFRLTENKLRGTVNFGNDIGWFRLVVAYESNAQRHEDAIAFEVFPVKMDMTSDLGKIHAEVDRQYPLWRFSLVQKTDQELAQSRRPHERFPLLWLAQFKALKDELLDQVKLVCNAPHNRLQKTLRTVTADRLHGKLPMRLEECVAESIAQMTINRKLTVASRKLSVNTPENRFVRMVLQRCSRELTNFSRRAAIYNSAPDRERLSQTFFNELDGWCKDFERKLAHPLFDEVGDFDGIERESLVLHQRAGYSGVYRIWQQLKLYLDVFGRHASISVKSVAELYEVWCLLEIRRQLLELGFSGPQNQKIMLRNKGFEKELIDGIGASFRFERDDGLEIRLAHEPVFGKPGKDFGRIYSWNAVQKPDIVLEINFPSKEKIIWVFDAKYRIESAASENLLDLAPDDALNQMHRYRDALIHLGESSDGIGVKARPVIGAFVLFPGWYPDQKQNEESDNPYHAAIEAVGIGAFPALPGQSNNWLGHFLAKHLSRKQHATEYKISAPDEFLAKNSVRISPIGLRLVRDDELIFVAPPGPNRTLEYLDAFRNGTARWYHTRDTAIQGENIPVQVMRDITYCAVVTEDGLGASAARFVYEVRSVSLVSRSEITPEQSGTDIAGSEGMYWLFELGVGVMIDEPVKVQLPMKFRFRITGKKDFMMAQSWSDMVSRYSFLYTTE